MANVINVPVGGLARSIHVQQIINWLRGVPGYEPVSLTGISHTTEYALTVANAEAESGLALLVTNFDGTKNLLAVSHAGTVIRPNTLGQASIFKVVNSIGTTLLDVTEEGVSGGGGSGLVTEHGAATLTNKTLTTPIINGGIFNYLDVAKASAPANPDAAHLRFYVVTAENILRYKNSSGTAYEVVEKDLAQTLTSKVLTSPTLTTPVVNGGLRINDSTTPTGAADYGMLYKLDGETVLKYKADNDTERTIVSTNQSQELTNKTITSPAISSPTFSGTLTFPSASIADAALSSNVALVSGAQTLLSKTLTTPNLENPVVTAIGGVAFLGITLGNAPGTPSGQAYLYSLTGQNDLRYKANSATERIIVDTNSTQELTNKTLGSGITLNSATLSGPLLSSYIDGTQITPPGAPSAGRMRWYAHTDGSWHVTTPGGSDSTVLTQANATTVTGHSFARSLLQSGTV